MVDSVDIPTFHREVWVRLSSTVFIFPREDTNKICDRASYASMIGQLSLSNKELRAYHQGEVQYPRKQEVPKTSSTFEPSRHHQQWHRHHAYRSRTYPR
jgi:hypothetical protein